MVKVPGATATTSSSATTATTGSSAAPAATRLGRLGQRADEHRRRLSRAAPTPGRRQVRRVLADWLNDAPETHTSFEDRVFGGAGLDILIANTGGDRLIDWAGEFNCFLVPFSPFGIATVGRQGAPRLFDSCTRSPKAQGRDPTLTADKQTGAVPARNGEPWARSGW